ncbi:MAG: aminopeptidase [Pseudomonadota bacterium]
MTVDRDEFFRRLADVAVGVGANVQPGQPFAVVCTVEHVPLARELGRAAWEAGAGDVQLLYVDQYERYLLACHGADDVLDRTPAAIEGAFTAALEWRGASVTIFGDEAPPYFAGADPARLARTQPKHARELGQRLMNESLDAWTVIAYPEPSWAARVFGEPDVDRLVAAIAAACRLDEPDPVAAWAMHLDRLEERAAALNERPVDHLRFRGPGTELTVAPVEGARWLTARSETHWGQPHCVNLPTEEIFTTPDFRRTEGTVAATRAVALEGAVIEGIRLRFEGGRVVEAHASAGEAFLREHLATDEGASALGEVALVAGSPIGATNLLFFNTLFDENAACHLAYGMAYTAPVDGSAALDADAQRALGINQSTVHVDFPIGGPELEVDAVAADGTSVPVLRGDDWLL